MSAADAGPDSLADAGPESLADASSDAPTCDAASPDLSEYDGGQFLGCLEYLRTNNPSQVAACEAECGCAGFLELCLGSTRADPEQLPVVRPDPRHLRPLLRHHPCRSCVQPPVHVRRG